MIYKVNCPLCNVTINIEKNSVGSQGLCPSCHNPIEIPNTPIAPLPQKVSLRSSKSGSSALKAIFWIVIVCSILFYKNNRETKKLLSASKKLSQSINQSINQSKIDSYLKNARRPIKICETNFSTYQNFSLKGLTLKIPNRPSLVSKNIPFGLDKLVSDFETWEAVYKDLTIALTYSKIKVPINLESAADGAIAELRNLADNEGFKVKRFRIKVNNIPCVQLESSYQIDGHLVKHNGLVISSGWDLWQLQIIGNKLADQKSIQPITDHIFKTVSIEK